QECDSILRAFTSARGSLSRVSLSRAATRTSGVEGVQNPPGCQSGRQVAVTHLLLGLVPDRLYLSVVFESIEQLVVHHRPGPVDRLLAPLRLELARVGQHASMLEHRLPERIETDTLECT